MTDLRRELEHVDIPGEHEARERTWAVVQAAFAEREPAPRRLVGWKPVVALAVAAGVLAAVVSPPGEALRESVRDAIGVDEAEEALFELPAPGRLLVVGDDGLWVAQRDGSKRLLGRYDEASWSPFGRFVVAARANELAALEPDGDVRWKLARPDVRFPRWGGSQTDTRIAYLSGDELRVVAGDGRGDRLVARAVDAAAPAWRPGTRHVVSWAADGGDVHTFDVDARRRLWVSPGLGLGPVRSLEWSRDGTLLLVRGLRSLRVLDASAQQRLELLRPPAAPVIDAAFAPDGRGVAFVQRAGARSDVWIVPRLRPDGSAARRVFSGTGVIDGIEWSPDGRWLLVGWRDAAQWVFVRTTGTPRIEAASNVPAQFESATFPRVEGWCCASR